MTKEGEAFKAYESVSLKLGMVINIETISSRIAGNKYEDFNGFDPGMQQSRMWPHWNPKTWGCRPDKCSLETEINKHNIVGN